MNREQWIENVRVSIINKAGLIGIKSMQLEALEKQASKKMGLTRLVKKKSDSPVFYCRKLVKHFGLDVCDPPEYKPGVVKKYDDSQRKKYNESKLGKFGAASGVRKIDPSTIDISKYTG